MYATLDVFIIIIYFQLRAYCIPKSHTGERRGNSKYGTASNLNGSFSICGFNPICVQLDNLSFASPCTRKIVEDTTVHSNSKNKITRL